MKPEITLPVAELKEALPGLNKIIGKSRTLPVLQTVRINRNPDGIVTLQATDLDSHLTYIAKEPQQGPTAEVLVPIDQLTKAMKASAPKEDIGIVPESKDKVRLRYNIAGNLVEQTITTLPVDEFPPLREIQQPKAQLEPQFGQALKEALASCSEDATRYVLNGLCLDVTDQKLHYVVGTDGRSLYSRNSFTFDLAKSVIIPDSKFLNWSDFLDDQPAYLSVEPGQEAQEAKDGKPAKEAEAGWVKLESPRWSFITREILGKFPNWRQCVPTISSKWTQVVLSEEAVKQLIQVVPNLPGADSSTYSIRLRVDRGLTVEGQNRDEEKWTSIPIQSVNITGNPVDIGLNRHYLLKGLRFGLNKLEIEDSLTPIVMSNGGKKFVIMPVRLDGGTANPQAQPTEQTPTTTSSPTVPTQPSTEQEAQPEERKGKMPRTAKAPGVLVAETKTTEANSNNGSNGNGNGTSAPIMSLVDHVDQIKDTLKNVIRDLSTIVDSVKQAEKEKRVTEKEIDAIRTKLRQIQSVNI